MPQIKINGIKIEYTVGNVRILNPHNINTKEKIREILTVFKVKTGYTSTRTMNSWIREWRAHNRLYKWGLFLSHTNDCDLEENEKLHRRIAYLFIGF